LHQRFRCAFRPLFISFRKQFADIAGQRRGELDATRPAEQLAIYFHYLYFGALMRWITDRRLSLAREFETVVNLFIEGAGA
jgi:hypothetical protein